MKEVAGLAIVLALAVSERAQSDGQSTEGRSPIPHHATVSDRRFAAVRGRILAQMEAEKTPSLAVAVAQHGRLLWMEAFGWADRDRGVPATPETVYALGSLSKSLTATGLMVLVQRGEISLDAPVNRYIAGLLDLGDTPAEEVSVRRVATMVAGIAHGWQEIPAKEGGCSIEEFLARNVKVVFPPGTVYEYSNNAYAVLEAVIERASGAGYAEFMRKSVFEPLGMKNTFASFAAASRRQPATMYYSELTPSDRYAFLPSAAAGGYSTVGDLIRYGMFHLKTPLPGQQRILSDRALDDMHLAVPRDVPGAMMALGWGSIDLGDGWHWLVSNGAVSGACSMLTLVPEEELAVAVVANVSSETLADETAIAITDSALPGFAAKVAACMADYQKRTALTPYKPVPVLLGSWEGRVASSVGETPIRLVFQDDGDIHVRLGDQLETLLSEVVAGSGELQGRFAGSLPNVRGYAHSHAIRMRLMTTPNRLYGSVTSTFLQGDRTFGLPASVSLTRSPAGQEANETATR